jgi:hypothetical protein
MSHRKTKAGGGPRQAGTTETLESGYGRPDVLTSAFDPIVLWRTLRADQFAERDVQSIDAALHKVELLRQPFWRDAVAGDAAAAIRVAVSFLPIDEITLQIDVAMTALLRLAILNDAAAAAAISVVLRNLPGGAPLHEEAGRSWLVKNIKEAYGRNGRTPQRKRKGRTTAIAITSNPADLS